MSGWSVDDLTALLKALAGNDPVQSLQAGLSVLRTKGIIPHEPGHGEPWLSLERDQQKLELTASAECLDEMRPLLEQLLALALSRVAEHEAHIRTHERMEMLSAASFEGLLIHIDGVVFDTNQRLAEILQTDRAELLGPDTLKTCVAPEDVPEVLRRMTSGFEGAYLITGVRKDGTRFRAELQSKQGKLGDRPIRVVAVRDVTERERTLALLRESETRLRDLADSVFDLTVLSRDGVIVDVSGPIEEMLGYSNQQVVGRPLLDFVAPSSVPLTTQIISEHRTGRYEAMMVSSGGELIPMEIFGIYSTLGGQPTRVAGMRDLREVRRLEHERHRLEQQLERTQRLDSLGVLAGGIAHDFNNLLVGVLGNADLMLSTTRDPDARELLGAIVTAGRKAAALTAQMLAYAGRGELDAPRPIDMGELIQELRMLLSASLSKKAGFVVSVAPASIVLGDRTTLSQLVLNLLTNASDALAGGVGRIEVRVQPLKQPDARWDDALGATVGPGDWVLLEVEDSGVGMDEATLSRIFEPFFSTKAEGHGLGLAACLGIVSSHGGALHVKSDRGKGSCFSLLLPAAVQRKSEPLTSAETAHTPCRVLVIDDEPVVRAQIRRSLELRGFSVSEASDGRSGLVSFERAPTDLVVVDMTMPDVDGADVVREIRKLGSRVPIVLTSGYVDATAERRLEPRSFQAFLRKPYGVAELLATIERARSAV